VVFKIFHAANAKERDDEITKTIEVDATGMNVALRGATAIQLTRQIMAAQPVTVRQSPRPKTRPRRTSKPASLSRQGETLRKALEWRRQLDADEVPNQAAIARREGITRARVTQIMGILRLAPKIKEQIVALPDVVRRTMTTEQALLPIATFDDVHTQF
jgi:hypothetical protein